MGADEGEYEFAAVRRALIKLSPDTIINQEKRPVPDRKPSQVTDQKVNERFRNRYRKPRDGKTGRYIAMRLMHTMQKKTRALKVCDGFSWDLEPKARVLGFWKRAQTFTTQRKRFTTGKILRHKGQQRTTGTKERQSVACQRSELPITNARLQHSN